MSTIARKVRVTDWMRSTDTAADITIAPIGSLGTTAVELRERASVALYMGPVTAYLRPNAAELRELIAALQWALVAEVAADEKAALEMTA